MGLSKFSASLKYTSKDGCDYEVGFSQGRNNKDANKVLLDLVEHLAWMGAVGGQPEEATKAFESGYAQGVKRRAYLDGLNKEQLA